MASVLSSALPARRRLIRVVSPMNKLFYTLLLLLSLSGLAHAQFATRYKVELLFERPGYQDGKTGLLYKWHRTVDFREDFHFFLDQAPLKQGYTVGSIAGVVYPKQGELHCSLSLWAVKELKSEAPDNGYSIAEKKFFKVPKSMKFELPLSKDSGFQKCTVTITAAKG